MRRLLPAAAVTVLAGAAAVVAAGALAPTTHRVVDISIHYSRFTPDTVRVRAGESVTFRLRNDDPIDHEWIVGDDAVHARHRTGTEPVHEARPTEVTIPALEMRATVVAFDDPGTYRFVCHLPGHEAYGMTGVVVVEASS